MRQIISSLFISMSFVTPLDYSVVNVIMVDHQPAVLMLSELRTAHDRAILPMTPGLGSY